MATKVTIKNQTLTSFGGIYYIEDEYTRLFADSIDHSLGLRGKLSGYQYSEIFYLIKDYNIKFILFLQNSPDFGG